MNWNMGKESNLRRRSIGAIVGWYQMTRHLMQMPSDQRLVNNNMDESLPRWGYALS